MHVTDDDVLRYLRMFTLLPHAELEAIAAQHKVRGQHLLKYAF